MTLSRLTTAESSYQALQRSYNDQSARLATAHADISNLTSSAATRKAASQTEVARLVEENRILSKRADETRQVVSEREAELEELSAEYKELQETAQARIHAEERKRKEAEKKAHELKATVDRLAIAAGEGNDVSASAALANEMRGQGKTYTEFYRDYTLQETRLQEAEEEVQRLTDLLDDISREIAEKVCYSQRCLVSEKEDLTKRNRFSTSKLPSTQRQSTVPTPLRRNWHW
jgi:nucleoprotein TPR